MVDLHQTEPGLPEGHPWAAVDRWGMAWRAALACAVVASLVLVVILLGSPRILAISSPAQFPLSWLLVVFVPAALGGLAALLGPWLRRFYPFSQGLIFGVLGAAALAVVALVISIVESVFRTCEPNVYCASPVEGFFWALYLLGLPVFLIACIGYQLAIWSATRLGARVRWALLGVAATALVAISLLAQFGVFDGRGGSSDYTGPVIEWSGEAGGTPPPRPPSSLSSPSSSPRA